MKLEDAKSFTLLPQPHVVREWRKLRHHHNRNVEASASSTTCGPIQLIQRLGFFYREASLPPRSAIHSLHRKLFMNYRDWCEAMHVRPYFKPPSESAGNADMGLLDKNEVRLCLAACVYACLFVDVCLCFECFYVHVLFFLLRTRLQNARTPLETKTVPAKFDANGAKCVWTRCAVSYSAVVARLCRRPRRRSWLTCVALGRLVMEERLLQLSWHGILVTSTMVGK